jgi:TolB-like protein
MSLIAELRRRSVFRMAALYLGGAWLIMQVVDVLEDPLRLPDWTASALLAVLVIGFPIALVLSWFYELTPEGVTLDEDVKPDAHLPAAGRRVDFIIIAVMAAALLLFAYDKWWMGPPPDRSVAVLPFVAMSSGEDDGYFSDGLTEEILNSLAQLPELQVTARTSSFFFKGKDAPIAEIAAVLGVAHIVEGSVRRDGERLRITSQLIRAADGFHLWSQTYDRLSEDIFTIQQDIAEKVAEVLNVVLDDESRERMRAIRINDVEAFIAYQKGLEYFQKAHNAEVDDFFEGLAVANTHFDKAIEAQPSLTAARILRADRAGHLLRYMINNEEPDIDKVRDQLEVLRTELDEAWRASSSGNQRDILNLERTLVSDDWTGLSARIRRAMQPGSCPKINFSEAIGEIGFAQELALKLEESLACNPLDTDVVYRLAETYTFAGRADESLEFLDRIEAKGVNSARFENARMWAQIVAGRFDDLEKLDWRAPIIHYLIQGNQAGAQQLAEKRWANPNINVWVSLTIAATVGDRARANEFAARIDKYPGSASTLASTLGYCRDLERVVKATGCRHGVPFDLEATPNFKARIEESGLQWPPVTYRKYVD